jgi:hypothetical protein
MTAYLSDPFWTAYMPVVTAGGRVRHHLIGDFRFRWMAKLAAWRFRRDQPGRFQVRTIITAGPCEVVRQLAIA